MTQLILKKIQSIGKKTLVGFVDDVEVDVYPRNPQAEDFQHYRRNELKISLGEGARRLGISVSELSAMEHGEYEVDWKLAREMVDKQ